MCVPANVEIKPTTPFFNNEIRKGVPFFKLEQQPFEITVYVPRQYNYFA